MASDTQTTQKPSYLGLLNAISLAESAAGVLSGGVGQGDAQRGSGLHLRLVAARERSHGEVFCRRIGELGYSLRRKPDPRGAEQLAKLANPTSATWRRFRRRSEEESRPVREIRRRMAEGDFDPMTVNLMNWYIAEEKDSGRRLREAYDCVRETAGGRKGRRRAVRRPQRRRGSDDGLHDRRLRPAGKGHGEARQGPQSLRAAESATQKKTPPADWADGAFVKGSDV